MSKRHTLERTDDGRISWPFRRMALADYFYIADDGDARRHQQIVAARAARYSEMRFATQQAGIGIKCTRIA